MSILLPLLTNFACVEPWWSEAVRGVTVGAEAVAAPAEGGWLLFLKLKVTEPAPKLASNSVAMLTCGGLPVAFCTTRNNLVTISMTWPVCKTKSPFLLIPSEERHPGTTLGWLRSSRVGLDWNKLDGRLFGLLSVPWDHPISGRSSNSLLEHERLQCHHGMGWVTAWRSRPLGCDIWFASSAGPWLTSMRWRSQIRSARTRRKISNLREYEIL